MLIYESKKDNSILTEAQYNELTEEEFKNGVDIDAETVEKYRENDSDFEVHEFEFLNDFGDFDLYTEVEDGNEFNCILVKYHQNVNQKDHIFLVSQSDTSDILELSDEFDSAEYADQKDVALSGIEDRLGLN